MIVYDLSCAEGHRFEGWFGSSADFTAQHEDGLLACPHCGSTEIVKAPMTPAVGRKGNQQVPTAPAETQPMSNAPIPPEVTKALEHLAKVQAKALRDSKWVGDKFAEKSREMHYGESDLEVIHGQATAEEAQDLLEEGIAVAPLPFPIAPPDKLN